MDVIRFGIVLLTVLWSDLCIGQNNCGRNLEFDLNFCQDSVFAISKTENLALYDAVKSIVYLDIPQNDYPIFKMTIVCKVLKNGEVDSTSIKYKNFDSEIFIEKDIKCLFNKIKRFKITGMTLRNEVTTLFFILRAWQTTDRFVLFGGISRQEE